MRTSLFFVCCLILGGTTADAQDQYLRCRMGSAKESGLQVAVATFKSAEHPSARVVLYGTVHLAGEEFYSRVQKDLAGYDLVLYEGIGVEAGEGERRDKTQEKVLAFGHSFHALTGLVKQGEAIDVDVKNMIHADMTAEAFGQALRERSLEPSPDLVPSRDALRLKAVVNKLDLDRLLAQQAEFSAEARLGMRDDVRAGLAHDLVQGSDESTPLDQVVIVERNKVVLKTLESQLSKIKQGTIAIFYGALHMPDLERRLKKLGWAQDSKRWLTAWSTQHAGSATRQAVVAALKTLIPAQALFREADKDGNGTLDYAASLAALAKAKLIDADLAKGIKFGYRFELCRGSDATEFLWMAVASPILGNGEHFAVNQFRSIRVSRKAPFTLDPVYCKIEGGTPLPRHAGE
jgi:hypothetical protein